MKFTIMVLATLLFPVHDRMVATDDPTLQWFKGLRSQTGTPCCSGSDGIKLEDPDWEQLPEGEYRVVIKKEWVKVPKEAVITTTNRVGYAVVWPGAIVDGKTTARCFLPGPQT